MTQEIVHVDVDYDTIQDQMRPWLMAEFRRIAETIHEQAEDDGHLSAAMAMVRTQALREMGRLYRCYEHPRQQHMVPEAEVQARIEAAVEQALAREVPLAVSQARVLWEQEKLALEAGLRERALSRVRASEGR